MTVRPALLGGNKLRRSSLTSSRHTPADLARLAEVLDQVDWGGIPFPNRMHDEFRNRFSARLGGVSSILVANGTVAISIALRALGLKAGDEVIVPALTWVATAAAAVHVNLVPVVVDVDPHHFCLDPAAAEDAITPRTRAIVVVHLANQVADMDRFTEIARRHSLVLVEDCAHAHFAEWRGKPVGTIGDAGTFSFESSKIMTSGEGGALVSRHPEVLARAMSLAHVGWKLPPYDGYEGRVFGFNARISEFQAAILLGQIEDIDRATTVRRRNLDRLIAGLEKTGGFTFVAPDRCVTRDQIYEVLFRYHAEALAGLPRDRFCAATLAEGVEIEGAFYEPVHRSPLFRPRSDEWPMLAERYGEGFDGRSVSCPIAERAAAEQLVWIHHSLYSGPETDVDDILAAVHKVKHHAAELRDAG